MATLAADKSRKFGITEKPHVHVPTIANDCLYMGSAIGESSSTGTYRPLVAGDTFAGFAFAKAENTGGAASDIDVELRVEGTVELPITGVSSTAQVGDTVYASDDDTFTTASTGNSAIGKIIEWKASTVAEVFFQAAGLRSL